MTLREGIAAIEELINSFPEEHYVELLEEMVDHAQSAIDARTEERMQDDSDDGA